MNFRFTFRILMMLAIIMGAATPVLADDEEPKDPTYNKTKVTRPDVGTQVEQGAVGKNGYKVFNPGSIAVVAAESVTSEQAEALLPATSYRSGSTDAWLNYVAMPPGWDHFGGHTSGSDLWEDEIWVDGFLKITTDANWRTSCQNHASGRSAYCATSFFQYIPRTIKSKSNHHFHKSGYIDNNFSTSDSA